MPLAATTVSTLPLSFETATNTKKMVRISCGRDIAVILRLPFGHAQINIPVRFGPSHLRALQRQLDPQFFAPIEEPQNDAKVAAGPSNREERTRRSSRAGRFNYASAPRVGLSRI